MTRDRRNLVPPQTLPAQARYAIDLLELLKEKTEGHRSPTESQLLDEILYDLRMRYVQVSRRG